MAANKSRWDEFSRLASQASLNKVEDIYFTHAHTSDQAPYKISRQTTVENPRSEGLSWGNMQPRHDTALATFINSCLLRAAFRLVDGIRAGERCCNTSAVRGGNRRKVFKEHVLSNRVWTGDVGTIAFEMDLPSGPDIMTVNSQAWGDSRNTFPIQNQKRVGH